MPLRVPAPRNVRATARATACWFAAAAVTAAVAAYAPPGAASVSDGRLVVSWDNIGALFRNRYRERSPNRNAHEAAQLHEVIGGGFRLDPVADSSIERDAVGTVNETRTSTLKVSQSSPWGTTIDVHRSETQLVGTTFGIDAAAPNVSTLGTAQGIAVKQELLRGGLYRGSTPGRTAAVKHTLDDLDAVIDFDTAFHKAISALLAAQRSARYLTAADRSLDRAKIQNAAVSSLVVAGYRAKADQLISGASEVRAKLRVEKSSRDLENAGRDLANAMWQNGQDLPLKISTEPVPAPVVARLEALKWPDEPTSLARQRVAWDFATGTADLAARLALPDLSLQVTFDRVRYPGGSADNPGVQKSGLLALSVPLVSSITREEVQLSRLDEATASAKYSETENQLKTDHDALVQKISLAQISLKAAQDLLDFAKQSSQLEMQKYRDGKSTINDMRLAQEDEDAAELAVIDATSDLLQARLDFGLAAGTIGEVLQ